MGPMLRGAQVAVSFGIRSLAGRLVADCVRQVQAHFYLPDQFIDKRQRSSRKGFM
jgi:hypothetical protein